MEEILSFLNGLGIKRNKAKAYLAVLKLQNASPHAIAKEAKLERTTIYKVMEELAEHGLVSKIIKGSRISYSAGHPNKLADFLEEQSLVAKQIIPLLVAVQGAKGPRPVVRFYDDVAGMRRVLMDSLNCQEKLRRDFALVDNVTEILGARFVHNQIDERVKKGIKVRSLRCKNEDTPPSEKDWYLKGENKDVLRETRYLDIKGQLEPLIIIYDHVVAIISSRKESYAVVIESAEFAGAIKILFDLAWGIGKK